MLNDEEKSIRDTVRDFVSDEVIPIIEEYNQEMHFQSQLIPKMAELGIFGPKHCLRSTAEWVSTMLLTDFDPEEELERGDSGVRSFASVQSGLVMYPIYEFGSEEQRKKYLPKLASAEMIGCFGLTEPDFGSNPGGMITKAEKVDGGYVINGAKMWITNGTIADVAIVWAKLNRES